jgi:2',3'-cyclic-nucleotide 2'-phosphodiesterase (5'-nucleotidase family)
MAQSTSLTIIQMNDSHAYLDPHQEMFWEGGRVIYRRAGGFARIATLAGQIRAENPGRVLFCDNGDSLHGTHAAVATQGRAMVPILNALGLDAMTAHWEFAYGPAVFRERAGELSYPVLASNVYECATRHRPFAPHIVKEVGGLRVGIVGIASTIVDKTMPAAYSEGLSFTRGRDELASSIDTLRRNESVDLVVLLSHLGFPQDMGLLSEVNGVDICLSGHTHNRLYAPVLQGQALVMQSGCHGSFIGRLDLDMSAGHVVAHRHRLIEVDDTVAPDPAIADLVHQALAPYAAELSSVVGVTATALNRGAMLETTMDNVLLDALLESTGAQVAFSNGWRFGAPIVPGEVTLNDLFNMLPMNPPVSTIELTGAEIVDMLEESLEHTFARDPNGQMGGSLKRGLGFTACIKLENPVGQRVQQVFVGSERLRLGHSYAAAFVTEQGVPHSYGRNREQHAERAIEALKVYLARHPPLRAELRGTFVVV